MKKALSILLLTLAVVQVFAQNTKENADFKLALNLYHDGLYDLAAEQLKQFIASYPATAQGVDARFTLGLAQMKLKLFEDARATFQSFALSYQDNARAPEAWWNVGESYAAVKNPREAALAFERVKVFHPKSNLAPEALTQSAKYFTLAGQPDDARRVLRIVLQEYASSGAVLAARTRLGELYFAAGDLERARNELKRVVEGDPSPEAKAQALLILGNIARTTGNDDQAAKLFREILATHGQSAAAQAARLSLGRLLAGQGRNQEALDNLKMALEARGPLDSALLREALIDAGDASAALKDYTGAARYYNAYFTGFPGDSLLPAVLWRSARINSAAKNYKRSNELCTQILSSGASALLQRRARIQLPRNAIGQGNPSLAVQQYQAFAELYPDDAVTPAILMRAAGLAASELKDPRKSAGIYEQVSGRYPRSGAADDALAGAAACYEQLREYDRALRVYRQIVAEFPSSEQRPGADRRMLFLETFEAKDKDSGLEKLALLLGDVVAERDKEGLAYRLGEVYFHDLKNFAAAASQFTNAINSGLTGERFVNALYLRAKACENLTMKEERYRQQAVESYETFLSSYGSDPRAPDAAVSLFALRCTDPPAARAAFEAAAATAAGEQRKDTLLLLLGRTQLEADSTIDALESFRRLVDDYPRSPAAQEGRYFLFRCYTKLGLADSAAATGHACLTASPAGMHSAELLNALGIRAMEQGRYADAREAFESLAENFGYTPQGANARPAAAEAAAAAGEHDAAVQLYRTLLAEQSANPLLEGGDDASLRLGLARSLLASGHSPEAKTALLEFLEHRPAADDAARTFNLLGLIARQEGSLELATSWFRRAESAAPDAPASREVADLLFSTGNYADALRQYSRLATAAPNERRYYDARMILCRLKSDDLSGIEKEIAAFTSKYSGADEERASFELEKGSVYYRKEDYAAARKAFDLVADTYDETSSAPSALYWTGKVLESIGKEQDALKQYENLLRKYPGSAIAPRVHLALGNLYYNAEKWDNAVQNYRKVVDDENVDPELVPFAMSNLIETYETAGIHDAALALTRKYLERYPNNEDSFDKKVKIGILYQRLGYFEQSALHLQSLLDQAGSDLEGEIRYYIGEAQYGKGDYQQAILEFLKVPYLVTKKGKIDWTANALYMSGQSYEKLGRHDQALVMYQQIVDRSGIDETFKAAARKEIERVRTVLKK